MKIILGAGIWVFLLFVVLKLTTNGPTESSHPFRQLIQFATTKKRIVELTLEPKQVVKVGDPVYFRFPENTSPVGRIVRVDSMASPEVVEVYTDRIFVELYGAAPEINDRTRFYYQETPASLEWVIQTMLPQSKREEIAKLITDILQEHRDELWVDFQPLIGRMLKDSQVVIQEDLRKAFDARQEQFTAIAEKYRADFIETEFIPVVQSNIWPTIQKETSPLVEEIGVELWSQASLWRLTWKYLYDASPLPQRDLIKKEFNRFVDEKATPILMKHLPEFLAVQKKIFNEVAQDPVVQDLVKKGMEKLSHDEDLKKLMLEIFQEVFVNNARLKQVWHDGWESPEMQSMMAKANEKLGPTVVQIGEAMFGNPRKQITPEFSDVLRSRVLFKDSRWIVIRTDQPEGSVGSSSTVIPGEALEIRPFHVPAKKNETSVQ